MLNKFINQGIKKTFIIPATVMEREDKAPSVSPSSIALTVPTAWEAVPKETPLDTLSLILNILNTYSPNTLPPIPVTAVKAIVKAGMPPICSDRLVEIAAVVDLGSMDISIVRSKSRSLHKTYTVKSPAKLPIVIPINMGSHFFLNNLMFLYKGTANTTVAGAIKKLTSLPPEL